MFKKRREKNRRRYRVFFGGLTEIIKSFIVEIYLNIDRSI